jgi:preprotein translocase subunit YajC
MELITVILSFVLTGIIGNFLVQRWQQRNWHEQHRLLRLEKEMDELIELCITD